MTRQTIHRVLSCGIGLGLLAAAMHLGWEYTHGGVQSHHLLARRDMPSVSNGWGLLVLPMLGWLASRSATRRAALDDGAALRSLLAFGGSLLMGTALSAAFAAGYGSAASGLFLATLAAGLVLPTYRAEYMFGFVLGMTFVLGAVLPTIAASIAVAISAVAYFVVRPAFGLLWRRARA